jgi:hypothetical protein
MSKEKREYREKKREIAHPGTICLSYRAGRPTQTHTDEEQFTTAPQSKTIFLSEEPTRKIFKGLPLW